MANGPDKPQPSASRVRLGSGDGSHTAYYDDAGNLVVEWYHFGASADYEFAKLLVFDAVGRAALQSVLGASEVDTLSVLAARFTSIWEVEPFIEGHSIPHEKRRDLWP